MNIACFDVEGPRSFLMNLNKQKAEKVLNKFNNDFKLIAQNLIILNNRTLLLRHHKLTQFQLQQTSSQLPPGGSTFGITDWFP